MSSSTNPLFLLLLLLSAISATFITQVFAFFIDFPLATNYEQLAALNWTYDTTVFHADNVRPPLPSVIQSVPNASVRVVYNQTFRLRNKHNTATFIANFVLNLGSEAASSSGNEGVAFILTPELAPPAGSEGQWLGIANSTTNGTAEARIFAIEFDTKKSFAEDVDGNHVGLDLNGVYSILQKPLSEFGVNLSAMADVFVRVDFDGENISVFVSLSSRLEDQLKNRVIFHPLNLSFLPDDVYVGFSASKFDFNSQLNWIKSWQFLGTDVDDEDKGSDNHHRRVYITVGVTVGLVLLFGVGFLWFWTMKKRKKDLEEADDDGIEDQLQDYSIAPRVQKFGFKELKKATDNFDPKNSLGKGGFGTVYKGNLKNREVAVKRISEDSRQGKQEFITEVATIGGLHHKNLVKLIGWCYEKRDFLLVYEFMPNGSLDKLIFNGRSGGGDGGNPNWEIRLNIIYGVAEALDYLHNGCEKRVLHRDVKSSNIMLDSKFDPKLGDFGLARTIRRTEETHHSTREIAGTRGYMAPEIFLTSRATAETDVYAFGVLVLEVVCGRKAANPSEMGGDYDGDITQWVWEFQERGEIVAAADGRISGEYEKGSAPPKAVVNQMAAAESEPEERDDPSTRRGFDRLRDRLSREEIQALRLYFYPQLSVYISQAERVPGESSEDRIYRLEEEWMASQGPQSEFALNVVPTARIAMDTQIDMNGMNNSILAADNEGTGTEFLWGFLMGLLLGVFMLLMLLDRSVPRKQKVGLLLGVSMNFFLSVVPRAVSDQ